jgi:hypothetical protein
MWLRDLGIKNTGAEVFGKLQNVVLGKNGKNKLSRIYNLNYHLF